MWGSKLLVFKYYVNISTCYKKKEIWCKKKENHGCYKPNTVV